MPSKSSVSMTGGSLCFAGILHGLLHIYIRKVERVGGQLYNMEFDVQRAVKDPGKTK